MPLIDAQEACTLSEKHEKSPEVEKIIKRIDETIRAHACVGNYSAYTNVTKPLPIETRLAVERILQRAGYGVTWSDLTNYYQLIVSWKP